MSAYQPKTGAACSCRPGVQRDNCPNCEGTGQVIDFAAIRARRLTPKLDHTPTPWALRGCQIISTVAYMVEPNTAEYDAGMLTTVVDLRGAMSGEDGDAAFIVRAANAHDPLLVRIRSAIAIIDHGGHLGELRDQLMQMLQIAEGKEV